MHDKSSLNGSVAEPRRVEFVSDETAGAILPIQAERIIELRGEVSRLKSAQVSYVSGALVVGVVVGLAASLVLIPPRQTVVTVEKPMIIEKNVPQNNFCLVYCGK